MVKFKFLAHQHTGILVTICLLKLQEILSVFWPISTMIQFEWSTLDFQLFLNYRIYHPLRTGRIWQKVTFFKRSFTGLTSEFSFSQTSCLTMAEELSLPYYLPIAGRRIIGFIPFSSILVLWEMQSVLSRFELVSPCPSPTTITITPRAPPKVS